MKAFTLALAVLAFALPAFANSPDPAPAQLSSQWVEVGGVFYPAVSHAPAFSPLSAGCENGVCFFGDSLRGTIPARQRARVLSGGLLYRFRR